MIVVKTRQQLHDKNCQTAYDKLAGVVSFGGIVLFVHRRAVFPQKGIHAAHEFG